MSTRFYPRFVRGNPQLRVFLPDWKMILVKSEIPKPENVVTFKVDPRMTDWDIKNYLEKIYKIQVGHVTSKIMPGKLRATTVGTGLTKDEDVRIADVALPMGQTFEWPDLFPQDKSEEADKDLEKSTDALNKDRPVKSNKDVPSWFL